MFSKQGILQDCERRKVAVRIFCACDLKCDTHLQKEVDLLNKDYISEHECERINMGDKCKMFVNMT